MSLLIIASETYRSLFELEIKNKIDLGLDSISFSYKYIFSKDLYKFMKLYNINISWHQVLFLNLNDFDNYKELELFDKEDIIEYINKFIDETEKKLFTRKYLHELIDKLIKIYKNNERNIILKYIIEECIIDDEIFIDILQKFSKLPEDKNKDLYRTMYEILEKNNITHNRKLIIIDFCCKHNKNILKLEYLQDLKDIDINKFPNIFTVFFDEINKSKLDFKNVLGGEFKKYEEYIYLYFRNNRKRYS